MNLFPILLIALGMTLCLGMLGFALAGPSTAKRARARLEGVRERYSQSDAVRAQVQMKRLVAQRDNRLDDMMNRFVPKPALLKQRLERTGKEWRPGRYVAVTLGIAMMTALDRKRKRLN